MTLTEYVESGLTTAVDNQQVRLMCGTDISMAPGDFPLVPYGLVNDGMLERARKNLVSCIASRFEHYDVFMEELASVFSWKSLSYGRTNSTEYQEITPEERAVIIEYNSFDMELYRCV